MSSAPSHGAVENGDRGLTIRQLVIRTLVVIATVLAAYLVYRLVETVVLLFVAIIVASAIRPLVNALAARGLRPGLAALLIYAAVLSIIAILLILSVPPIVGLSLEIFRGGLLERTLQTLAQRLTAFGWQELHVQLPASLLPVNLFPQLRDFLSDATDSASRQAGPITRGTLLALGQLVMALVMGFYWLTSREAILGLLLSVSAIHNRARVELIWNDIEETLAAWIRGQALLGLTVGVAAYVGLFALNVPYAAALAVVAGLTEMIPLIGPFLGAVPAVLIAFNVGPQTGLLTAVWYLLVQQVEGMVLVPRVMQSQVGLHPLVVITALIAGATLNGVVGALLAVPVAGALQVLAKHLFIDPAIQDHGPRVIQESDLQLEPVEEAAVILPRHL